MDAIPKRQQCLRRIASMELERSSWLSHWREINTVLLPRTGRFFVTDTNRGTRRNDILDDTATAALTTLGAGMQSGMTSPARPWVRLETQDRDLMENANVSRWLDLVTTKILDVFARSNTYRSLHTMYEELGAYGVAATIVLPDFDNVIHHYPLTIGEYCLGANDRGVVDSLSRHFEMTVGQIVERFVMKKGQAKDTWDWEKCSPSIKNMWDQHQVDSWIPVYQLIQPRRDRDTSKIDNKNMAFESIIFEAGANQDKLLSESGYRRFPVLAPRWQVSGNDIYGSNCPGMRALGGIQQLQFEHMRKMQGIDYQTKPPLQVPTSLKNSVDSDLLPGGVSYVDQVGPQNGIRTAFDVQLDLQHLLLDIQDVRQLIKSAFYADVFLSMEQISGAPITAREVQERHEEKLLMLGPVVERQQNELLAPLIDITFDALMEAGVLPPPPEELQESEILPNFVSVLAQAQRATAMASVDRWVGAIASIAAAKQDPGVWDNIDVDEAAQKAAGYLGVDPEIARGKDEVQQIREARQQAQQAQIKQQAAQQAAETAKTLAAAPMNTDNALTNLVQGFATQ